MLTLVRILDDFLKVCIRSPGPRRRMTGHDTVCFCASLSLTTMRTLKVNFVREKNVFNENPCAVMQKTQKVKKPLFFPDKK